jgi:hypothetical protein
MQHNNADGESIVRLLIARVYFRCEIVLFGGKTRAERFNNRWLPNLRVQH